MQQTLSPALKSYPIRQADQGQLARRALSHVRAAIRADTPETERHHVREARYAAAELADIVRGTAFNERASDAVTRIVRALEYARGPRSPWLTVAGDLLARLAQPTEGR